MARVERSSMLPESDWRVRSYSSEVVYVFAFDVAYELKREPIARLLDQPVAQFAADTNKRSPRQLFFYRPQMVRLPPVDRVGPRGPIRVERTLKVLPVGAVSITVRVPFEVQSIGELVVYHDLQFSNGNLYDEVRAMAEQAWKELRPFAIRPVERLGDEEAYTVFCIKSPLESADGRRFGAEDWLRAHRREVAALVTQESDVDRLSEQEVDESIGRSLSYYDNDLVVVDWDAALLIDEPRNIEETLHIMELANVQLAELEAYDRLLDAVIDRSYRDLADRVLVRRRATRRRAEILRELGELRIDLARLSDELQNITKFFGDWHLARLYQAIGSRFHLSDWYRALDGKLKTLDEMYQLLKQDQNNRWMLILEATIVLLFVIDLIVLMRGG